MSLKIAYLISENQVNIKTLNLESQSVESNLIDSVAIKDESLGLLLIDPNDNLESLQATLTEEEKFYPIVPTNNLDLTKEDFEGLNFDELYNLYKKVSTRWILNNNIKSVEQVYPTVKYLKD